MTNAELVDSKRFCAFMDSFVADWPKADDAGKDKLLNGFREYLNPDWGWPITGQSNLKPGELERVASSLGEAGAKSIDVLASYGQSSPVDDKPKKKRGRPKKVQPTDALQAEKAALLEDMRKPLSAAETARLVAQAKAETAKVKDPQLVVNEAVEQVIKPNWATTPSVEGYKHFIVHAVRNGSNVSFELEKWQNALRLHGLPAGNVNFKPEGLGMSPGSLETGRGSNAWRVIIG